MYLIAHIIYANWACQKDILNVHKTFTNAREEIVDPSTSFLKALTKMNRKLQESQYVGL